MVVLFALMIAFCAYQQVKINKIEAEWNKAYVNVARLSLKWGYMAALNGEKSLEQLQDELDKILKSGGAI